PMYSPAIHLLSTMESNMYDTVLDPTDGAGTRAGWYLPDPLGFQVSLASSLLLQIVLGVSSNLAVLVLYGLRRLEDSLSNMVTMNLHVLDTLTCVVCAPLTVGVVWLPLGCDVALLCCVTFSTLLLALLGFFLPFLEMELFRSPAPAATRQNRTALCVSVIEYRAELGLYYHLLLQVPAFFTTAAAMLVAYARILRALHVDSRFQRYQSQRRKRKKGSEPGAGPGEAKGPSQVVLCVPSPCECGPRSLSSRRCAVKRHWEHQKRVFRMSLVIVSTFLLCWAPSPSRLLIKLRLCFLAMAYGTTVFHPLLYAFRKKRVVSVLQVDPAPGGAVIHNSWVEPSKGRWARPAGTSRVPQQGAAPGFCAVSPPAEALGGRELWWG
uniref:G-protein coupled receptors family 1 profile domain-containing protein n=1 Tax=Pelusios castaneus TaxID=367368 RepID=A0A8C8SY66_9SAUR